MIVTALILRVRYRRACPPPGEVLLSLYAAAQHRTCIDRIMGIERAVLDEGCEVKWISAGGIEPRVHFYGDLVQQRTNHPTTSSLHLANKTYQEAPAP